MSHSSFIQPDTVSSCILTGVSPVLDINTKPPECVDYNPQYHEVFTTSALEARVSRTSAFRAPGEKTE